MVEIRQFINQSYSHEMVRNFRYHFLIIPLDDFLLLVFIGY